MNDRPSAAELIDAVRMHLETEVIPAIKNDRKLYFQTLVAMNVLKIVSREMEQGYDHTAAEWYSLNQIQGVDDPHPIRLSDLQDALLQRNTAFAQAIRQGDYDGDEIALNVLEHLKEVTIAQLKIANPKFLEAIAAEEAQNTD